jgi:hypothetical protein
MSLNWGDSNLFNFSDFELIKDLKFKGISSINRTLFYIIVQRFFLCLTDFSLSSLLNEFHANENCQDKVQLFQLGYHSLQIEGFIFIMESELGFTCAKPTRKVLEKFFKEELPLLNNAQTRGLT